MRNSNVALLTDFGLEDIYPGVMKGVINSVNPGANIIDLTHSVLPQNVLQGAFLLYASYRYFPPGTVFCAVVDPGVGSDRRAVAVRTEDYLFTGPDNGILWPAASDNRIMEIVELADPQFFLGTVSSTFHGRDVFAPAAAHLSMGTDTASMGNALETMTEVHFSGFKPSRSVQKVKVVHVDTFGNIILDIRAEDFQSAGKPPVKINRSVISGYLDHYSAAKDDTPFFVTSSSGFVEIALKNKSASSKLNLVPGDTVSVSFLSEGKDQTRAIG